MHSLVMADRVQALLPQLKKLHRMKAHERKKFIKTCGGKFIHELCECIKNLLKGNVPVKLAHLNCLQRHKQSLRALSQKKTSLSARKKILQKGGFLGILLKPLIGGLVSLLTSFLSRNDQREENGSSR